ncbi:RimK/LysX family protein [Candidatus Saccharibacteria bacterium]|nr:RimK/LysX family protein [Candidatus Saccharibacteria bacterium]
MSQPAKKKQLVIVFTVERDMSSTRYGGFGRRLQKYGGLANFDITTVALENLAFIITEDHEAHVIDTVTGIDLASVDFVYFKSWESMIEEAAALANYLYYKGVQFVDTLPIGMGISKLATFFRLWSHEVRMPYTVYIRRTDRLREFLQSGVHTKQLGDKFVVKDYMGEKGHHNYLASTDETRQILEDNPDKHFVCQRFIPNKGDWRVGVYMDKPSFVIKRMRADDHTHLNNTSAGGHAEYYKVKDTPMPIRRIAKRAAVAANLQISGVDVIEETDTGKLFVLEVNQGSQIVTGANAEQNIRGFTRNLEHAVREQYGRPRKQPMKIIGRRTTARLRDLGIKSIVSKVDTGAFSSSLHAENIHIKGDTLHFDIMPSTNVITKSGATEHCAVKDFFTQNVRSSNGHEQARYSIRTRVSIDGRAFQGIITLSDRSEMGYPFLIGRRLIRSRFLVNVELNEAGEQKWNY